LVQLVDDTLREGLQSPGISFKIEEKIKIAELLGKSGIENAIVSYPSAHWSEKKVTEEIINKKLIKNVYGLGRAIKSDIDEIFNCGAHIALHFPFKYENIDKIIDDIKYSLKKDEFTSVALVDVVANRSAVIDILKKLDEIGLRKVQLPDTTGNATPKFMRNLIKDSLKILKNNIDIEVHCHNDYGLSVSNCLAAIEEGATSVSVTVYGIGERNGIADLFVMYNALKKEGYNLRLDETALLELYKYVEDLILKKIGYKFFFYNFPIVGINTNTMTAGTHASYISVFSQERFSVNVYAGKSLIKKILDKYGINLSDEKLASLVNLVKEISVKDGKALTYEDVLKLSKEV
jgi:2-isopropylmalate synthase